MSDLRYPIGAFSVSGEITPARIEGWIAEIAEAPALLRAAVHGLNGEQANARLSCSQSRG